MSALIVLLPRVHVGGPVFEHEVEQSGQLVGRSRDGLGLSQVGFLAPQEGAQGGVAAVKAVGSQAEGGGSPVGRGLGLGGEDLAPGGLAGAFMKFGRAPATRISLVRFSSDLMPILLFSFISYSRMFPVHQCNQSDYDAFECPVGIPFLACMDGSLLKGNLMPDILYVLEQNELPILGKISVNGANFPPEDA